MKGINQSLDILKLLTQTLSKFGTTTCAENKPRYLLELNWVSPDNSRNRIAKSQQPSYKIREDFVSEFVYNLIDFELPSLEESNISTNLNETSTSSWKHILNPQNILKNLLLINLNRLNLCATQY